MLTQYVKFNIIQYLTGSQRRPVVSCAAERFGDRFRRQEVHGSGDQDPDRQ